MVTVVCAPAAGIIIAMHVVITMVAVPIPAAMVLYVVRVLIIPGAGQAEQAAEQVAAREVALKFRLLGL